MYMKIEITWADIDAGVRKDSARCPTALAIARATGKPTSVEVVEAGIVVTTVGGEVARIPQAIQCWTELFEIGARVGPGGFVLMVP